MTEAATAFVSPLTFQAVCGAAARVALFDSAAEAGMSHIELARWADHLLIAPATADVLARLAAGLGNDLLSTVALASEAPLWLAPAMNQAMWRHAATRANVETLRARGARVLGPASGAQACGDQGPGRMLEPLEIVAALLEAPAEQPLADTRVLLTAGPTREALDPVRYLGNRSSGRMGYALAEALTELGARVSLISGPSALRAPAVAEVVQLESALQMHAAVMARVADCDLFVGSAAVADYRAAEIAPEKIKKTGDELVVRLVRNPDILAEVAARDPAPFMVGFAAETEQLESYARAKLLNKRLDMIAANQVGTERGGFEHEDNALLVLWGDGQRALPMMSKPALARELAALIAERYTNCHAST